MPRGRSSLLVMFGLTALLVTVALVVNPFRHVRHAIMWIVDAGPEDAAIKTVWRDPATQEVSDGQRPGAGLDFLRQRWRQPSRARRAVLIGNSQTLAIVLAPGERPSQTLDRTYPDIAFATLRDSTSPISGYRLGAPNLSYMEAAFYVDYLLSKPDLRPSQIVLQLNYESFRKSGIRDGMLELLADPDFFAIARAEANEGAPYAAAFQGAIERYQTNLAKQTQYGGAASTSRTGIAESYGMGNRLERGTRGMLTHLPGWTSRSMMKADFLETLYLLRVYVLRITPSTKRSLGGATLVENQSAIERIGALCARTGVELILFNAPQNPLAPLYRTDADREQYHALVRALAARYATRFFDFEESIPAVYWGRWIDGPDPIHMGRAGHRRMAKLMLDSGVFGSVD